MSLNTLSFFMVTHLKDGGMLRWSSIYILPYRQILLPDSLVFRGVALSAPEALFRSIQLLHLDQACVKHLISNLADCHSSPFRHGHKNSLDVRMDRGLKPCVFL